MPWYYVEAGQPAGPVDDPQLAELRRGGRIGDDTLVFREGMANWQPYAEAMRGVAPPPLAAGGQAACAECGQIHATGDMVAHGSRYYCARCKPILLQKLAEGAVLDPGALRYAGFWIRAGATLVDGLVLSLGFFFVAFLLGLGLALTNQLEALEHEALPVQIVLNAAYYLILVLYEGLMVGRWGATVGKMACRLKVVTADGAPLTYGLAFGRVFAKVLSYFTCYIGFIMAGPDEEKRALHDRICGTRVVYK